MILGCMWILSFGDVSRRLVDDSNKKGIIVILLDKSYEEGLEMVMGSKKRFGFLFC